MSSGAALRVVGSQPIHDPGVGNSGAGPGKTTIREFVLTKLEDRISMELYLAAHDARAFDTTDVEIAEERGGNSETSHELYRRRA